MTYSPDQLHNAIETGLPTGDADISALVRLARRLFYLQPAGPSREASQRMEARFEAVMAGEKRNRWAAWLPFVASANQRPSFVQKFAAGALAVSAIGGATSVATGVSPVEAALTTIRIVASATANLAPHTVVQDLTSSDPAPSEAMSTPGDSFATNPGDPTGTPDTESTPVPGAATASDPGPDSTSAPQPGTPTPPTTPSQPPLLPPSNFGSGPLQPTQGPPIPTATPTANAPFVPPVTPTPSPTATSTAPPTPTSTATPAGTPTATPSPTATPTSDHDEDEDDEDKDGPEPSETPEPTETPEPPESHR